MNILGNNSSKLNDVIFQNRNKAYGAYEIRESYTDSLKKSMLCLAGLVTLLFGSVFIYNKINAISGEEKMLVLNDPNIETYEYVTEVNNKPLETPVENTAVAAAAPEGGMATRIIDNAAVTATTNINNPVSGVGSATATGVSTGPGPDVSTVTISNPPTNVTSSVSTEPVIFAEEMPDFDGSKDGVMKYVAGSVVYPEIAKEAGIQGVVYVTFVVNENGKVEAAKVLKGIGLGCDEEVLRVINKMPTWKKIGKNANHPVKVRFNIPVSFRLK
ncbi:MAG: energy transducer TonB [Bacteroidota bacterium]